MLSQTLHLCTRTSTGCKGRTRQDDREIARLARSVAKLARFDTWFLDQGASRAPSSTVC
jgi:hypothetical protein